MLDVRYNVDGYLSMKPEKRSVQGMDEGCGQRVPAQLQPPTSSHGTAAQG
jgi:hypothetical protein